MSRYDMVFELRMKNAALSAEVAALKAENQKMHHDWMADHAEMEYLKADLAKYTEPLTEEQADAVVRLRGTDGTPSWFYHVIDAAIRRVRRGE